MEAIPYFIGAHASQVVQIMSIHSQQNYWKNNAGLTSRDFTKRETKQEVQLMGLEPK